MDTLYVDSLHIGTIRHGSPRQLVNGLSLQIKKGCVTALVGASGSGKSMTALAIQNSLPHGVTLHSGGIHLGFAEEKRAPRRGHNVASIMQNPRSAFNPVLNMRDHARETLAAVSSVDDAAIHRAITDVGLIPEEVLQLFPFQMSGGMLQRMMIALALLSGAGFLIADEPTTDLDLVVQSRILDLLMDQVHKHEIGMLFITHDMGVVARVADEVLVMDAGHIVEQGDVEAIFEAPRHPVTQHLLAAHLALYPEEQI